MRLVDALFDRTIDVLSEEGKTVIRIFSRTVLNYLQNWANTCKYSMYKHNILARRRRKQTIYSFVEEFPEAYE